MEDLSPHDQVIINKILNMEEDSQHVLMNSQQQQYKTVDNSNNMQLCNDNQVASNPGLITTTQPCSTNNNTVMPLHIQTNHMGLPKDLRYLQMEGFSDLVSVTSADGTVSLVTTFQPKLATSTQSNSPITSCTDSPSSNQPPLNSILEQQQMQNNLHMMSHLPISTTSQMSSSTVINNDVRLFSFVSSPQNENINALKPQIHTERVESERNTNMSESGQNMESDSSLIQSQGEKSMLHHLLTSPDGFLSGSGDFTNTSSPDTASSPDYHPADSPSSLSSPASIAQHDPNTQATLIVNAGRLHLDSESGNEELSFHELWSESMRGDDEDKGIKTPDESEHASLIVAPAVDKVFDPDCVNNSSFTFTMFGSDQQPVYFSSEKIKSENAAPSNVSSAAESVSADDSKERHEMPPPKSIPTTRSQTHSKRVKEPSLNQHFPWKIPGYELRILDQPEEQHRARYLTEGSRGAVKNKSQEGHPVVKLFGQAESAVLQVFIGNDAGKVKPHGFYQACKVCGKNSTPAREKDIDGTTVIEMDLTPVSDMSASVDNVGILKLRNADVEQRIGLTKAKKKSVKARMIFRAVFRKGDGNMQTLQIASNSILCTQPIGQPEVCKMSRSEYSVLGRGELFLIGKNFMKGTKVFLQEVKGENNDVVWEKEAEIDKDYFQPTHLICTIPPYKDTNITQPVVVQIVAQSSGKLSDPQTFTFLPEPASKQDTPMETQEVSHKRKLSFTVSPEALELNQQIQHTTGMFQLPPGTISTSSMTGVTNMQVDTNTMESETKSVSLLLNETPSPTSPETKNVVTSIEYDTKPVHIQSPGIVTSSMDHSLSMPVGQGFQQTSPIKKNTSCSAALLQAVEEMKSLQRSTAAQHMSDQDQQNHQQHQQQQISTELQQHFLSQGIESVQEALLSQLTAGKFLQQQDPLSIASVPQLPILREHLTSEIHQQSVSQMSSMKTEIPTAIIQPSSIISSGVSFTNNLNNAQGVSTSPRTVQSSMGTHPIMTPGTISPSPMATIIPSTLQFQQVNQPQKMMTSHVQQLDVKPTVNLQPSAAMTNVSGPQPTGSPQIIICGQNNANGVVGSPQFPAQQQQANVQPLLQPQQQQQQQQQPAPMGPSIFILPGGGAGGANSQVENILRSILGSLQQQQPLQQQQQL